MRREAILGLLPKGGVEMSEQLMGASHRPGRRAKRLSMYFAIAAIGLSLFATAIVLGNVAAGAPREPDENAWAHLFQLSMAAQVPLILLFLVSADWTRRARATVLLCAQVFAAAAAFGALAWSGY
jgi:hypothetical protein